MLAVRKVIPVEQGLRQSTFLSGRLERRNVRKVIPVEQGLRLDLNGYISRFIFG